MIMVDKDCYNVEEKERRDKDDDDDKGRRKTTMERIMGRRER